MGWLICIDKSLYSGIKDITDKNILQYNLIDSYILEYHILTIEKEIFLPKEKEFFQKDGIWYKNLFIPTKYLEKRFKEIQDSNTFDNFIINFIVAIVNESGSELWEYLQKQY